MKIQIKGLLFILLFISSSQSKIAPISEEKAIIDDQPNDVNWISGGGTRTIIVEYCYTTVIIFWYYYNGTFYIEIYVFTTCIVIVIHHYFWRNLCLRAGGSEIEKAIGNGKSGGQISFKSGFDKQGSLKSFGEENSKGQVIKSLQISKENKIEEKSKRSKLRVGIEKQINKSLESAIQEEKINPENKVVLEKRASFDKIVREFDGIRHQF